MAQNTKTIDHGQEHARFVFAVNTDGMKYGEKRSMHITGEHLSTAAGISHIDILNPVSIQAQVESTAGKLGLSLHHDEEREKHLATASRAVFIDQSSGRAEAYHAISTSNGISDIHTLKMTPTADQLPANVGVLHKRINTTWGNFNPSNVYDGVHKSTLNDETRYLITETAENGEQSAIHQLLTQNATNPKLLNGKYMAAKCQRTSINGKSAIVMKQNDFEQVSKSLYESLKTKSPFNDGLNVSFTKSDSRPTSRHPSYAHIRISRIPLDASTGYKTLESNEVTDAHVAILTGTTPIEKAAAITIAAPGFEDVVSAKDALHTNAKVEPFIHQEGSDVAAVENNEA